MAIPVETPPMPRDGQPIPPTLNLRCVRCGYSLTGLISRICPECGQPFDPLETFQTNVKCTWEFHFTYRCPLWQYVVLAGATLIAIVGFVTVGIVFGFRVYRSPQWYIPGLLTAGAVFLRCYLSDWRGPLTWIILLYIFLAWAVIAGIVG